MVKCSKKEYCENRAPNVYDCSESEGCKLDYSIDQNMKGDASKEDFKKLGRGIAAVGGFGGKCVLNEDKNLPNTLFNGGFGYGKVCVPDVMTDFVIMLVYPPAYVFLYQKKRGFPNITMIITSFILTSCFYFPGLIHAMYLKQTGQSSCGGLFTGQKNTSSSS